MKRALLALVLLAAPLLAACGGGSSQPSAPAAAPTEAAAVAGAAVPDAAQLAEAKELGSKLGCAAASATPGGGASVGAAELQCTVPAPKDPDISVQTVTEYDLQVDVFSDPAALQAYVGRLRAAYNPNGVQGDRWLVTSSEPDAVKLITAKVGGSEL